MLDVPLNLSPAVVTGLFVSRAWPSHSRPAARLGRILTLSLGNSSQSQMSPIRPLGSSCMTYTRSWPCPFGGALLYYRAEAPVCSAHFRHI
jgi:hypothetical protein